jgi:hypothetical protein
MKLIHAAGETFQFEISEGEKGLLFHLLQLYPLVPAPHYRLSKDRQIPNRDENQRLLDEALSTQRLENRKQVEAMLQEAKRFAVCAAGYLVTFSRGEMEWLLQVFNDVRLGSWIALGSPDQLEEMRQRRRPQAARHVLTMDLAAFFEMAFLGAISGELPPGHE